MVVPNEKQITKKNSIRTKEKNDGIAKIQRVYSGSSETRFKTIGANVLKEETDDQDITDAATVIIGSELSASERKRLTDDLLTDIRKMSERGDTIIATAVALE